MPNLEHLIIEYSDALTYNNRLSMNTIYTYRTGLKLFLSYCNDCGYDHVSMITPKVLDSFRSWVLETNRTEKSFETSLTALRGFFRYIKSQGIIQCNPITQYSDEKKAARSV